MNASVASGLVSVPTSQTAWSLSDVDLVDVGIWSRERQASAVAQLDRESAVEGFTVPDQKLGRLRKLRMNIGFAARAHAIAENGKRPDNVFMVTLTYQKRDAWEPKHISNALSAYRMWCQRQGVPCRYVWVAELQKRGAVHYHIAAWLPRGARMPKWDSRGWWKHGSTQRVLARRAVPYLLKYFSKGSQSALGGFPSGCRLYSVGGVEQAGRRARAWLNRPGFVQGNSSIWDRWRRAVGGGWRDVGGCVWASEYQRLRVGERFGVIKVLEHGRTIEASGPFSWWDSEVAGPYCSLQAPAANAAFH